MKNNVTNDDDDDDDVLRLLNYLSLNPTNLHICT